MSRFVPNENSWVGFATTLPVVTASPTKAEIDGATELTKFLVSINATAQGNTVPTPSLDSLFETSVPGTSAASFTADFYRDDEDGEDIAWDAMKRGTKGVFYISRFGTGGLPPEVGDKLEVWPVQITTRAAGAMSSNTVQTFSVTAAVNIVPAEDAVVVAGTP